MKVGILKESGSENRVVMLPEGVTTLLNMKTTVMVEKGAGESAYATDQEYEDAGARITNRDDVIRNSDLLLKIHPPDERVISGLKEGQVLLAAMNPFFNLPLVKELAMRNITVFSIDVLPRITRAQAMDILSSQATVAGYKAVLDAAGRLPGFMMMFMSAAGTIKPAKVLILGAGVAGLQAIATARKLGAVVEAFDVRAAVKEEVESLGAKFVEVEGAEDDASAGGYAVEQTEEFKKKQQQAIHNHAVKSNIVICTAQIPGRKAPLLIHTETVEEMLPGSVIIDLAASTGGNCELTRNGEVIEHKKVIIVGKTDYPSDMPNAASKMFGKNVVNFMKLITDQDGNLTLNFEDELVKGTCLSHNKEIIHEKIKELV